MGYQKLGRIIEQITSTATAAGTTTLTNVSSQNQRLTGTSTQTIVLPDATTCPNGMLFRIKNESTNQITIKYDDGTTLTTIDPGFDKLFVLFDKSTTNGVWSIFSGSAATDPLNLSIGAQRSVAQVIPNTTVTTIIWDVVNEDNTGSYDDTTGEFTVPIGYGGFFLIDAFVDSVDSTGAGEREFSVYVNGSLERVIAYRGAVSFTTTFMMTGSVGLTLQDGDVVTLRFRQTSGGNLNVGDADYSGLTIVRYNAVGLAPSPVYAQYNTAAGQSLATDSIDIINFGTLENESSSGLVTTGASWKFTSPITGIYEVAALISWTGNVTGYREILLYKNNSQVKIFEDGPSYPNNSVTKSLALPSCLMNLDAGDFIDIRGRQGSGGNLTLVASGVFNYINIKKVG